MSTETATQRTIQVKLPIPHPHQASFIDYINDCLAKKSGGRAVVRAGRRGGKTVGAAEVSVEALLAGSRVLYTAPTAEQVGAFWYEVTTALAPLIEIGYLKKNESEKTIEKPGTEQRIKAKTAWNADTLRGDWAHLLIFDEFQLTDEDAWQVVGAPMLLDVNGTALFIYTPPSLRSAGVSKARDPRHAAKMFKMAQADTTGKWRAFHFTSHDNPHINTQALTELIGDMSKQAYRQEIMAEDDELQLSWLVYKSFNEALCKIPRFEIPKNWLVYSGHDFGSSSPACLFFARVKLPLPLGAPPYMRLNDLVCFREYLPGGLSAPSHVNTWKEITQGYTVQESVGGNVTTEEQTRQLYSMHGWFIKPPKITRVNAQIDRVVGLMELNKIYCFNDNIHWLEELMNCLWELDSEGNPTNKVKDESKFHLSSCARTLLSTFTPETVVAQGQRKAVSNH